MYVYTCECRSRRSLWMGLCLGVKKNIQDTPNCIINGQSVVIVLQVNGNGKLELLLKLQSFPVKKRFFSGPSHFLFLYRLRECGIYHCRNKRTRCSLFFSGTVQAGAARSLRPNRFPKPSLSVFEYRWTLVKVTLMHSCSVLLFILKQGLHRGGDHQGCCFGPLDARAPDASLSRFKCQ